MSENVRHVLGLSGGKDSAVIPMYSMGTKRNGKFQSYLKAQKK